MFPASIVGNELFANAATFDGRQVTVSRVQYSVALPGSSAEGYSVDVSGNKEHTPQTHGFTSYAQAMRFIKSPQEESYTAFDVHGNRQDVAKTGLGVPNGMIREIPRTKGPAVEKESEKTAE